MAGERRFTRIPPESTGDRVHVRHSVDVPYTNKTGTFFIGQDISFASSFINGIVSRARQDTSTTGVISVSFSEQAVDSNAMPTLTENILSETGEVIARVASDASFVEIYTNANVIVGYDETYNGLAIDSQGSASIRFGEGAATLDAFGKLRVSMPTVLGNYSFPSGVNLIDWSSAVAGTGSITHNNNGKNILISTGSAIGDSAKYTSDQYHHYTPGVSTTSVMTVAAGDTGKAGLRREWGYGDDANGIFFRLDGTTLQAVIRESTSGSVSEIVVYQDDWNGDRANGLGNANNRSGANIVITNINIYWMDLQWLGGGRIRFGIYDKGQRIVCHEYYHTNLYPRANLQSGSLPVRLYQENTGSVGSTSEIKFWCAAVATEASVQITDLCRSFSVELSGTTSGSVETFLGGVRPTALLSNGAVNHNLYFPQSCQLGCWDTVASAQGACIIRVYAGGVITGGTWNQKPATTIETNLTGTVSSPGSQIAEYYVFGSEDISIDHAYKSTSSAIKNKANGTQQGFYMTAQRIYGTNDNSVRLSYGLKELRI